MEFNTITPIAHNQRKIINAFVMDHFMLATSPLGRRSIVRHSDRPRAFTVGVITVCRCYTKYFFLCCYFKNKIKNNNTVFSLYTPRIACSVIVIAITDGSPYSEC